jgi:deazaflavin-dependent oxidoreductase (nitroreductase family)
MYLDGKYVPERARNPLVSSPTGGRLLSGVQLPWFMIFPPLGFGVLMTRGRKTGKTRRKCIRAIRREDKTYLVAIGGPNSAWLKNALASGEVGLRTRSGRFSGAIREPCDEAEREEAMSAFCGDVNPFDYAECAMHRRGRPGRTKITGLHREWFEGGSPLVFEPRR